jgi:hypothetical protein
LQPLIAQFDETMVVCAGTHFHAKAGDPPNLKVCPPGTWNVQMRVETVLSMLTMVCHLKQGEPSGLDLVSSAPRVHHGAVQ